MAMILLTRCKKPNISINIQISSLIARLAKADTKAFSEFYKLNYNRLLRYGLSLHWDTDVVADVIQDLFVWLLRNPSSTKNINNLEVYLFKSLKRNLLRYRADHAHLTDYHLHENPENSDYTIEERIIQQETKGQQRKVLYKKLDKLPAKQREVIYLRYYEGLSYEEMADILSTTNQVVRNYVSRALIQLRKSLDSY